MVGHGDGAIGLDHEAEIFRDVGGITSILVDADGSVIASVHAHGFEWPQPRVGGQAGIGELFGRIMPAINKSPISCSETIPYITSGTDGGIIIPRVPPDAIVPDARLSLYLYLFIAGIETLVMVAAVASDEPHTAEKPAHATTVDKAKPPLN